MVLQFYSAKAYAYVRKTFKLNLPAPSTIRGWLANIQCEPGFSQPSFVALNMKAKEFHEQQAEKGSDEVPLLVALMLDEISIKRAIEFDKGSNKCFGYIDFGCGDEELEPATDCLVFMVVGINCQFKIPLAYFFITKLSGAEKSNLVVQALSLIQEKTTGIVVVSLTCDGPTAHIKMLETLGCKLSNPLQLDTGFQHPITNRNVYAILDVVHMLKLMRNNWEKLGKIKDCQGGIIDWQFIVKLQKLQEEHGFKLANKLGPRHIAFRKQIMKVNLAAQTLSSSVADALLFLCEEMQLDDFKNVAATVQFIRNVDGLFDLLNSRNPFGRGYKTPLREANEFYWKPFMMQSINSVMNCTTMDGTPLMQTRNKTGFLGFVVSALSLLRIYSDCVQNANWLKYVLTYRFSQDHLELFFCSIRSRNGCMTNPTCLQFSQTYKRLLLHGAGIDLIGNCAALDQTDILTVGADNISVNETDIHFNRVSEGQDDILTDCDLATFTEMIPLQLNEFKRNVISYIAGYVVRAIKKKIKCPICLEALIHDGDASHENSLRLIVFKSRGGLILPSTSVTKICEKLEKKINLIIHLNDDKMPRGTLLMDALKREANELFANSAIFPSLYDHIIDAAVLEECHKKKLINYIIMSYGKIRINSLSKAISQSISGQQIRQQFSRLIIWKHQ